MTTPAIELNKPLPFPGRGRWGYQHYPVFSKRWWLGRSLVFCLGAAGFGMMSGIGMLVDFTDKQVALSAMFKFMLAVSGMVLIGPSLATLARSLVKPGRIQAGLVCIAILLGIAGAAAMDAYGSHVIEEAFRNYSSNKEEMNTIMDASKELNNMALALFNAFTVFIIYFWCAGGIAFIRYWREPGLLKRWSAEQELQKARADKHQAEATLSMLQAQIEPHFLFNTLASVKSVLREQPQRAEMAIDDLVDYLRASIPRLSGQERIKVVKLQEQLTMCEKYLQLMQLRMGDRLRFSVSITPAMRTQVLPPLFVISLVENAIKHGLEPKPEGGEIQIKVFEEGRDAIIEVSDSGVGLNGGTSIKSTGVGLKNLRNQLNVLYPDRATLELSSNIAGGATACIRIANLLQEQETA